MPGTLRVGSPAPSFSVQDTQGETVSLEQFRGRRVILYFYPKDDTPGCTREACSFRDEQARFTKANAVIVGVSRDTVASHQRFAKKFGLPFQLLSDPDAAVCKAYGVWKEKSMYGRTYWGIERTTFVIDEQGRIAAIFPKVTVDGHSDEVFQALGATAAGRPSGRTAPARTSR